MIRRIHFLLAPVFLVASLAPLTVYAEGPIMDAPTQAALTALRTNAAALVAKLPNNKAVLGTEVTASYSDQLTDMPSQRKNTVMIVKARAERAAWKDMDPTSRALIKSFFAAPH